jgi:hypothetical protein
MGRRRLVTSIFCVVVLVAAMTACSALVSFDDLSSSPSPDAGDAATADAALATDGASPGVDAGSAADASGADASGVDASFDAAGAAYEAIVLADNPIAYFRMNEAAGGLSIASAVGTTTGAFSTGVTLGTPSPVTHEPANLAATFTRPGLTDSDLALTPGFTFEGNQPFSIEAWVKPSTIDSAPRHVFSHADRVGDYPVRGYNVCVALKTGNNVAWIERSVDAGLALSNFEPIVQGAWSHVVAIYDGTNLVIVVNGAASAPLAQPGPSSAATMTPAYIGSANGGGNNNHGYLGDIDELAIYDKVLPPARIAAHYAAGKP